MAKIRNKTEEIHRFIISHIDNHPNDIAKQVVRKFEISRQAANGHLQRLVEDKVLDSTGATRNKQYSLRTLHTWQKGYELTTSLKEDAVWADDINPLIKHLPKNVFDIWDYGFTEMFNNAIEHSGGGRIEVFFQENAALSDVLIMDDGVGIFKKIQAELGLPDERHATLELAKGKFTTDPENHSGEGIFFTSRIFSKFDIASGEVHFSHAFGEEEDWIWEAKRPKFGTAVLMQLNNYATHTIRKTFDKFTAGDDGGFNKTIIPVRLAQYGDDNLVSRSQAKRLLTRIDCFTTVIFDFEGVESIGQAFADEIFRVFARRHPEIELGETKANNDVKRMIRRARSVT